jgi:hypothetical protein
MATCGPRVLTPLTFIFPSKCWTDIAGCGPEPIEPTNTETGYESEFFSKPRRMQAMAYSRA